MIIMANNEEGYNVNNEGERKSKRKIEKITEYRVGMKISNYTIEKIYFVNEQNNFLIIKSKEDGELKVFGPNPKNITYLLSECNYLTDMIRSKENKNMSDYQRAAAINAYLVGDEDNSKQILKKLQKKLEEKIVIRKKLIYIGVYLFVTLMMVLISYFTRGFSYSKYIRIATFGAFGGYIALNVKLNDVKFEVSENNISYIIVSIYKLVFAMVSAILSYFVIESNLILGVLRDSNKSNIYLIYTIAALAGFSESLLPNLFKNMEKDAAIEGEEV